VHRDPLAGGLDEHHYYEFKSDGTFACGQGTQWKCTGKWTANANSVYLSYATMNDKTYEEFRAEVKKGDDSGVQVGVARALVYEPIYDFLDKMSTIYLDDDQKHLTFSPPTRAPAAGTPGTSPDAVGDLSSLLAKSSIKLERMDKKTD